MPPVLDVAGLSVTFSGRDVLRNVRFAIAPGEFCGLIGANGSGKTTLLRSILGLQKAGAGGISINGAAAYVPQKNFLDPELPLRARDLVALGLDGHRLGLPLPRAWRRRRVDEMLHAVGAEDFADQRVGRLSGGQQQRVLIAHALIRRPDLLLLDEPLANLDIRGANEIVALLARLAAGQNVAVLLSAHDINPLLPFMHRVVYLAAGRAVAGTAAEVVRTEVLSRLYGAHIDVIRVHGRILVIAGGTDEHVDEHPVHVAPVP